jgi:saccharopine dehydrogenase (NADP+, L-glutamate forming)
MKDLHEEAKALGLNFLNELGVDPGIDHMSAMKIIDRIKANGGNLISFKSYCGGLVAPACDDNPWHYKFSWNPRNVVVAGQGTAQYKENGNYKYVAYNNLFHKLTTTSVNGYGNFEIYPNRDSLQYCELYNIVDIPTIMRGTLRRPGYAEAWNVLVRLGCTDDTYKMKNSNKLSNKAFIESFLPHDNGCVKENLSKYLDIEPNSEIISKLEWLNLFSDDVLNISDATPAMFLQKILEKKWTLGNTDRDLLVMQHQFEYENSGIKKKIISSMTYEGKDREHTAMSYTVGTPIAIAAKLLATGKINLPGVHIPTTPKLYKPILKELHTLGVKFTDEESVV